MVLQAYIDDSSDEHALILAGYISTADNWGAFTTEWKAYLSIRPVWKRFKMSEIMATSIDAASWPDVTIRERVGYHHKLIQDRALAGICVAIPRRPLVKVVNELGLPKKVSNPYFLAWRTMMSMGHTYQREMGFEEPIDFIFDRQSETRLVESGWSNFISSVPEELAPQLRNSPVSRSDDDSMPLQAADLLAWWVCKRYHHFGTILKDESPFPWPHRQGPRYLLGELNEAGIRHQLAKDQDAASW